MRMSLCPLIAPSLSRYAGAMDDDNDILAAIDKANPMRARSPLARWMLRNYDAFAARYTARRADWSVLAQVFADAGLTDADGKPPTGVTARKTWQRVRQTRKQMALEEPPETRRQPARPPPPPSQTAAAASSPPANRTFVSRTSVTRPARPAEPARHVSAGPVPVAAITTGAGNRPTPDAVSRVLAEMDAKAGKLTEPLKR